MAEQQSFLSSWQERLTALRNTPPVLKIVWQSGPGVVIFGLVARLFASLLPLALLWIPKLIVDDIVHAEVHRARHVAPVVVAGGERIRPRRAGRHSRPRHRLLGLAAGGQIHPPRKHPGDEARRRAGPDRLRRPGVLRPAGTGAGTGHRPAGNDSADRAADPVGDYDHDSVGHDHCLFAVVDAAADCGSASRHFWARAILPFWDTPRIFARLRSGANWIICGRWGAARKLPRNSNYSDSASFSRSASPNSPTEFTKRTSPCRGGS